MWDYLQKWINTQLGWWGGVYGIECLHGNRQQWSSMAHEDDIRQTLFVSRIHLLLVWL